jgi:hypothetical protein
VGKSTWYRPLLKDELGKFGLVSRMTAKQSNFMDGLGITPNFNKKYHL